MLMFERGGHVKRDTARSPETTISPLINDTTLICTLFGMESNDPTRANV
jgi:hypothetical protein